MPLLMSLDPRMHSISLPAVFVPLYPYRRTQWQCWAASSSPPHYHHLRDAPTHHCARWYLPASSLLQLPPPFFPDVLCALVSCTQAPASLRLDVETQCESCNPSSPAARAIDDAPCRYRCSAQKCACYAWWLGTAGLSDVNSSSDGLAKKAAVRRCVCLLCCRCERGKSTMWCPLSGGKRTVSVAQGVHPSEDPGPHPHLLPIRQRQSQLEGTKQGSKYKY